jgi:hypothetical protein
MRKTVRRSISKKGGTRTRKRMKRGGEWMWWRKKTVAAKDNQKDAEEMAGSIFDEAGKKAEVNQKNAEVNQQDAVGMAGDIFDRDREKREEREREIDNETDQAIKKGNKYKEHIKFLDQIDSLPISRMKRVAQTLKNPSSSIYNTIDRNKISVVGGKRKKRTKSSKWATMAKRFGLPYGRKSRKSKKRKTRRRRSRR